MSWCLKCRGPNNRRHSKTQTGDDWCLRPRVFSRIARPSLRRSPCGQSLIFFFSTSSKMGKGGEGPQQQGKEKKITLEELSQHRTPNDAWMSYRGKVYDVSKWEEHPGACDKLESTIIFFVLVATTKICTRQQTSHLNISPFPPSRPNTTISLPSFPPRRLGDFHARR